METAPDAIRLRSAVFIDHWEHFDFDFNDVLLANRQIRIVDCGDVDKPAGGGAQDSERITAAVRTILKRGAMPIALGTDEGGFIPFVRAYGLEAEPEAGPEAGPGQSKPQHCINNMARHC